MEDSVVPDLTALIHTRVRLILKRVHQFRQNCLSFLITKSMDRLGLRPFDHFRTKGCAICWKEQKSKSGVSKMERVPSVLLYKITEFIDVAGLPLIEAMSSTV
jgi:hypothetical protein